MTALPALRIRLGRRTLHAERSSRLAAVADLRRIDDAALVARVAGGDERALGELHDRHVRLALAIAHRIVGDAGISQEVVQDAFVDLWRTAPSYEPERAAVTTWLVRLVRLRAIDRARRDGALRRGAGVMVDEFGDDAAQVASSDDVHATVAGAGTAERVRAALDELPPDQRRVVELSFLHGHTHAELAELLELPIGTIKTRCFRGLARLAPLLADERDGGSR